MRYIFFFLAFPKLVVQLIFQIITLAQFCMARYFLVMKKCKVIQNAGVVWATLPKVLFFEAITVCSNFKAKTLCPSSKP